jgi:hypothetical protein
VVVRKERTASGARTEAASNRNCREHVAVRLAVLKKILLAAYCSGGLKFDVAENMAARVRQRYPQEWSAS